MVFSCNSSLGSVNPRYRTYSSNIIRVKTVQNLNETENTVESIRIKKNLHKKKGMAMKIQATKILLESN